MAKLRISNTESIEHDSAQIEGVQDVSYAHNPTNKRYASDGESTEQELIDHDVTGEVVFDNASSYNEALANSESNLIVNARKKGGGTRVFTIKNVLFDTSRSSMPTRQATSGASFRLSFRGRPGPSDTPDTMVTDADGA